MSSEQFNERMRLIRFRMKRERFRFWDECRLVPRSMFVIMALLYMAALFILVSLAAAGEIEPPWPDAGRGATALFVAGMVTIAGLTLSCVVFLIGYVNQDAKRRGMNSGLWTMLVILLLPAWLLTGFVIYFLVREPLPYHCTQCGALVSARFAFCPSCRCNLRPTCPHCNREVSERFRYCPHCGYEAMAGQAVNGTAAPLEPDPRTPARY
jgi:hypothetical protein